MVFTVGSKMYHPNKNNDHFIATTTAATIIFTLAIMAASNMATPAAATTTTSNTTTTYSSGIELSPKPIYQEHIRDVSETDKPDPCTVNCGWKWNANLAK